MLFVAATAFDINDGVAMTPLMVLYLIFFVTAAGVVIIAVDPGDPDIMRRPPRDPKRADHQPRGDHARGCSTASCCSSRRCVPLVVGPDEPSTDAASASMTMTFAVMGLGTVFNALTNRRDPVERPRRRRSSRRSRSRWSRSR